MKRALLLAAAIAAPATAATVELTVQAGQWVQVFANDVERATGRSVRVDTASVAAGGLGRQFRQASVLLRAQGPYPYGTTIYALRSVNCAAGQQATHQWSAVAPSGAVLGGQAYASPPVQKIHWDSQDGKVLKFICQGILPR
ncbi:hypothetical protein [Novosphingobium beihaiensis]|uniref:Uncharacterized protein n=1 Tax=Novosphingobium beihaiensis TaxID=2930389 RepID=A0ABT0BUX5_9SPHN|nr:hypothetical protein [Novosphingobium beihaiensis]MCJ2188877.1 hypothetical protein [Novosphingobium beihaiensis]